MPRLHSRYYERRRVTSTQSRIPPNCAFHDLICIACHRDDAAGWRGVAQFHLNLLGLFLHSHPSKFSDEMKNFHRWPPIFLRGGDFSTLQITVHRFPPYIETIVSTASNGHPCSPLLSSVGMRNQRLRGSPRAHPTVRKKSSAGVHELLPIGHQPARVFGARGHLLAQPFLISRDGVWNRMSDA